MKDHIMNKIVIGAVTKKGQKAARHLDEMCVHAGEVSRKLLLELMRDNEQTEYGKKYGFKDVHCIKDYQRRVPFSTYDDYAEYIEQMVKENAENLITSYPVMHYAVSSGSVGNPKNIPVSQRTLDIYTRYSSNMMFALIKKYYQRNYKSKRKSGRGLYTLEAGEDRMPNGIPRGPISATSLAQVKKFIPYIFTSPIQVIFPKAHMDMKYLKLRYALEEKDLSFMVAAFMTTLVDLMSYMQNNWEILAEDIEKGTINPDIDIPADLRRELEADLKPDPGRAASLRREFERGFDTPVIPRIWANLSFISAIGTGGFTAYTEKMRKYSGAVPIYFSVYGASEALIAVAKEVEEGEFILIPDSGFYEFLPVDSEDENTTLTIEQLEAGKDYEIVLTNLSGFYRYKIQDVIRVTGFHYEAPKIKFVYRKNQMISIAGEKTNDECVSWAVEEFCREAGCIVADYSIYADTNVNPGRYVVFMEPDHIMPRDKMDTYRDIIEEKLGIGNPSFGKKIKSGVLGKTVLYFEQLETYALYRDLQYRKGISANQLKPVKVIDNPVKEKFFFGLIEKD